MYEIKAHRAQNYLYVRIQGLMYLPELTATTNAVLAEAKKLQPGFAIINDISEARTMSPESTEVIMKTQQALFAMGAAKVIRIISAAAAGLNLQIARAQREGAVGYKSQAAATLKEALDVWLRTAVAQ